MSSDEDMKRLILILVKHYKCDFEAAGDFAAAAFLADGETEPLIKFLETGEPLTPNLKSYSQKWCFDLRIKRRPGRCQLPQHRL